MLETKIAAIVKISGYLPLQRPWLRKSMIKPRHIVAISGSKDSSALDIYLHSPDRRRKALGKAGLAPQPSLIAEVLNSDRRIIGCKSARSPLSNVTLHYQS